MSTKAPTTPAANPVAPATGQGSAINGFAAVVGAWIFVYRLVPETKGKSLEQIEAHWRSGKIPARAI